MNLWPDHNGRQASGRWRDAFYDIVVGGAEALVLLLALSAGLLFRDFSGGWPAGDWHHLLLILGGVSMLTVVAAAAFYAMRRRPILTAFQVLLLTVVAGIVTSLWR